MTRRRVSLLTSVANHLFIWALKAATSFFLFVMRIAAPSLVWTRPIAIKSYACRHGLQNRVFFPKSYSSGSGSLPLILDIYGGAFTILGPEVDDSFCAQLANTANALVVSLDHRKSPLYRFPTAVYDVAAVAHAVIHDPSLPVDRSRIAMLGFSSGGNLCLTTPQLVQLGPFIKASVSIYPVLDFVPSSEDKQATLDRNRGKKTHDPGAAPSQPLLWGYVSNGVELEEPLLSPIYAPREVLPEWIYLVGAEMDGLCDENERMAESLAQIEQKQNQAKRLAIEGVPDVEGWSCGRIRWEKVLGYQHGFTHNYGLARNTPTEAGRLKVTDELIQRIANWLRDGPFA